MYIWFYQDRLAQMITYVDIEKGEALFCPWARHNIYCLVLVQLSNVPKGMNFWKYAVYWLRRKASTWTNKYWTFWWYWIKAKLNPTAWPNAVHFLVFPLLSTNQNSKWVWSGNTTITNRRQPHGTARKSHSTITRHQEDKLSKTNSFVFPI